jgi:hypothetical protein
LPLRTTTGYGTCAGTAVCRRNTNQEDTMTDTDWKQQLAFLDRDDQNSGDTITNKELTIRLLLAIRWQANREDCPDAREDWQKGTDHSSQGNLHGAIDECLKHLGFEEPDDGFGYYDFSNR